MDYTSNYNVKAVRFSDGSEQLKTYSIPIKYNVKRETVAKKKVCNSIKEAQYYERKSIQSSNSRAKSRVYLLARENVNQFVYFVTLTFNPSKVDSYNYDEVVKHLSCWLSNIRKRIPDLAYIAVPERHRSGRFHFHLLTSDISKILVDSGKTKNGKKIFNVSAYRLGFSTASLIENPDRCCTYLTKYLTKDLIEKTKNKKRYWYSRNLKNPKIETSYIEPKFLKSYQDSLEQKSSWKKTLEYELSENKQVINIYELKDVECN